MKPPPSSPSRLAAGTAHVGERELGGVLGVHADLVEVAAALEAGHPPLHHQQADPLMPGGRIGPGGDDHQVAHLPVGDEGLAAVEQVVIAVADGGGADPLQVAARPGLGHGDRGDELAGAVPRQPPLALLGGGQAAEVVAVDVVVHGEPRPGGAGHRQFLVEDQVVAVVRVAAATVLLVDLDPEQPGPAGGEPDVPGHHPVPLPLLVVGGDLTGDEGAHHVAERVVLGGEDVTLHRRAFLRSGMAGGHTGGRGRSREAASLRSGLFTGQ